MVKLDLSLLQVHGNSLEGSSFTPKSFLNGVELCVIEESSMFQTFPPMTSVENNEGTSLFIDIMEGDPGSKEIMGTTGSPVGAIGMPTHDSVSFLVQRGFVNQLIIKQPEFWRVERR
jgi:hypothetical protein